MAKSKNDPDPQARLVRRKVLYLDPHSDALSRLTMARMKRYDVFHKTDFSHALEVLRFEELDAIGIALWEPTGRLIELLEHALKSQPKALRFVLYKIDLPGFLVPKLVNQGQPQLLHDVEGELDPLGTGLDFLFRKSPTEYTNVHTPDSTPFQTVSVESDVETATKLAARLAYYEKELDEFRTAKEHLVNVMYDIKEKNRHIEKVNGELIEAYQQIEHLARTDELTQIYNRRGFWEAAELLMTRALKTKEPIGLVSLDVDRFKKINDSFGHDAGDAILIELVKRIQSVINPEDSVGRVGGDEFAVIVENADLEKARSVGEKIRNVIGDEPFSLPIGAVLDVRSSVGATAAPPDALKELKLDTLLKVADMASYTAKKRGNKEVMVRAFRLLDDDASRIE